MAPKQYIAWFLVSFAVLLVASEFVDAYLIIKPCSADGYDDDHYIAYCGAAPHFDDYEHGAFIFGTESKAIRSLQKADVLFLGDSKLQFALSGAAVPSFFDTMHLNFYELGFGYISNAAFVGKVLEKWRPTPKLVVINADPFFSDEAIGPQKFLIEHPLFARYLTYKKLIGEKLHRLAHRYFADPIIGPGTGTPVLRSRKNGSWSLTAVEGKFPVDERIADIGENVDPARTISFERVRTLTKKFRHLLPATPACTVLVYIPSTTYSWAGAESLAREYGFTYLNPKVIGLKTMDHYHLDAQSAARWAAAFLEDLRPVINHCAPQQKIDPDVLTTGMTVDGGFVTVPFDASINPAVFTVDAWVRPDGRWRTVAAAAHAAQQHIIFSAVHV